MFRTQALGGLRLRKGCATLEEIRGTHGRFPHIVPAATWFA
jgi:hypothetical protein